MNDFYDTIAAISTPKGTGGIAVVRTSGNKSIEIVDSIFKSSKKLKQIETRKALVGKVIDNKENRKLKEINSNIVDEVVVTVFRNPHSYTGEDVVEISCHGGIYISEKILQLCLQHGARIANPGEFTRRAFINGRLDLVQAEAVADLIASKTKQNHKASIHLLTGAVSKRLNVIRDSLVETCSLLELELDFSDEDIELVERKEVIKQITKTEKWIEKLINSYEYGKIIKEGVKIVLTGRPNVGKSSLLNALLMEDRAIVTNIPGTTRDTLIEDLDINGYLVHITDTAGIQKPQNIIESEGIKKSEKQIQNADIIIFILDGSEYLTPEDINLFKKIQSLIKDENYGPKKLLVLQNKMDLPQKLDFKNINHEFCKDDPIWVSAKTHDGLDNLKSLIVKQIRQFGNKIWGGELVITRARHRDALMRARESLLQAKSSCFDGLSNEFISFDLRASLDALGEITGQITSNDILNKIFSDFCIGK